VTYPTWPRTPWNKNLRKRVGSEIIQEQIGKTLFSVNTAVDYHYIANNGCSVVYSWFGFTAYGVELRPFWSGRLKIETPEVVETGYSGTAAENVHSGTEDGGCMCATGNWEGVILSV